jgi:hypothetical protein
VIFILTDGMSLLSLQVSARRRLPAESLSACFSLPFSFTRLDTASHQQPSLSNLDPSAKSSLNTKRKTPQYQQNVSCITPVIVIMKNIMFCPYSCRGSSHLQEQKKGDDDDDVEKEKVVDAHD